MSAPVNRLNRPWNGGWNDPPPTVLANADKMKDRNSVVTKQLRPGARHYPSNPVVSGAGTPGQQYDVMQQSAGQMPAYGGQVPQMGGYTQPGYTEQPSSSPWSLTEYIKAGIEKIDLDTISNSISSLTDKIGAYTYSMPQTNTQSQGQLFSAQSNGQYYNYNQQNQQQPQQYGDYNQQQHEYGNYNQQPYQQQPDYSDAYARYSGPTDPAPPPTALPTSVTTAPNYQPVSLADPVQQEAPAYYQPYQASMEQQSGYQANYGTVPSIPTSQPLLVQEQGYSQPQTWQPQEFVAQQPQEFIAQQPQQFVAQQPQEFIAQQPQQFVAQHPQEFVDQQPQEFVAQQPQHQQGEYVSQQQHEFAAHQQGEYLVQQPQQQQAFLPQQPQDDIFQQQPCQPQESFQQQHQPVEQQQFEAVQQPSEHQQESPLTDEPSTDYPESPAPDATSPHLTAEADILQPSVSQAAPGCTSRDTPPDSAASAPPTPAEMPDFTAPKLPENLTQPFDMAPVSQSLPSVPFTPSPAVTPNLNPTVPATSDPFNLNPAVTPNSERFSIIPDRAPTPELPNSPPTLAVESFGGVSIFKPATPSVEITPQNEDSGWDNDFVNWDDVNNDNAKVNNDNKGFEDIQL